MRVKMAAACLLAGLCLGTFAFAPLTRANGAGLATPTTGSISGTVLDAAGQPIEEVCVVASTQSHNGGEACTGANGEYTITGLAPGEYGVEFIPYASDTYLVGQIWPHHQGLSAKGAPVSVRSGHDHKGIDASLVDGGRALVVVSTSSGQRVSDEIVCPVLATRNAVDGNCGGTDLTGEGTTGAAPAGVEKVEATGVSDEVYAPGTHSYRMATTFNFVVDQTIVVAITIPKSS
jgi:hypothetical protein